MEFVVIFLATLVVAYIVLRKTNHKLKQTAIKKSEIINNYERELKALLEQHNDDKITQLEQKKRYLKQCNDELSRNIFFTADETSDIIQKLANI
jgi:DNA anti-recombination protein RmuC